MQEELIPSENNGKGNLVGRVLKELGFGEIEPGKPHKDPSKSIIEVVEIFRETLDDYKKKYVLSEEETLQLGTETCAAVSGRYHLSILSGKMSEYLSRREQKTI